METRYQYAKWYVKLYRWLRYKPVYTVLFAWDAILWLLCGAKLTDELFVTRISYLRHMWRYCMAMASTKMQYYYTLEEIIADMRQKYNESI